MSQPVKKKSVLCCQIALLIWFGTGVWLAPCRAAPVAQEVTQQPATVEDAAIPLDHLQVKLRSLTKDELTVELAGWLDLLRAQIRQTGEIELQLKQSSEGESNDELTAQLLELRTVETELSQRVQAVIDELKIKGGNPETEQAFVNSVSSLAETTDALSFWTAVQANIKTWYEADDGGQLFKKRAFLALLILFVFWLISRFAGSIAAKALSRHTKASTLLENFARQTTGWIVFAVGILTAVSVLGIQVGPLVAALGAGGFIVGFALQETLASFASGLMIMIYQPFDVDDFVAIGGETGKVKMMSLVSTTLQTVDNKLVVIPNKNAWGETIVNYTASDTRRVDMVFGISYDDDIRTAMELLRKIAGEHSLVLDLPEIKIHVAELADSSVNLLCGPWVKTADYWTVHWDLTRQVKEQFDAAGISFPYPQHDVHMQSQA